MSDTQFFSDIIKWACISIIIGTVFGIIWAIIFWDNDLFYYHWLAVPISMFTALIGGVRAFRKDHEQ